jgi:hypothetical protein
VSVARAFQPVISFTGKTKRANPTGWKARATKEMNPPRPFANDSAVDFTTVSYLV